MHIQWDKDSYFLQALLLQFLSSSTRNAETIKAKQEMQVHKMQQHGYANPAETMTE